MCRTHHTVIDSDEKTWTVAKPSCISLSVGEKATLYADSSLKMETRSGWLVSVGAVRARSKPSPSAALPLLKALNSALPDAAGPTEGTSE